MGTRYRTIGLLAVLIAQAFTITPGRQTVEQSQSTLSPTGIKPVLLNVTVTNKAGEFVPGLKAGDFEVTIDKKPATIESLSNADSPASVGIVIDLSPSMIGRSENVARKHFAVLREALGKFLKSGNQSNEYFLIGFTMKSDLLVDWTSDHSAMLEKIVGSPVSGTTALYDAIDVGVDKLRGGRHTKRSLIILSDGHDNHSKHSFRQTQELLKQTDLLLYSIYFPAEPEKRRAMAIEGLNILEDFSSISGGRLFYAKDGIPLKPKDVNSAFEVIATELRSQYTLSIVPSDSNTDKKWRKLKVKLMAAPAVPRQLKGLSVRTRQGFYAN